MCVTFLGFCSSFPLKNDIFDADLGVMGSSLSTPDTNGVDWIINMEEGLRERRRERERRRVRELKDP